MKKLLSLLLAIILLVGTATPVLASNENTPPPTGDIKKESLTKMPGEKASANEKEMETTLKIHKLVAKESFKKNPNGFPFDHNGGEIQLKTLTEYNEQKEVKGLAGVEFTYYKVASLDQLEKMKKDPTKYDSKKELDDLVANNKEGISTGGKLPLTTEPNGETTIKLKKGYYWFIETDRPTTITGVVAVPFGISIPVPLKDDLTIEGTAYKAGEYYLNTVYLYPKNTEEETKIDKAYRNDPKFGKDSKALKEWEDKYGTDYEKYTTEKATIDGRKGSLVPYDVKTKLIKGQIYKVLQWSDAMTKGLTYNKDMKVQVKLDPAKDFTDVDNSKYSIDKRDNGFDLTIENADYIKTINAALEKNDVEFRLVYSAKINGETIVNEPEENNITFTPGKSTPGTPTPLDTGELKVKKNWSDTVENRSTKVRYILEKDGKTVAQVYTNGKDVVVKADEGIKFKADDTDKYSGTFTGLDKDATYKFREFVNGYEAKYDTQTKGQITIENKFDPSRKTPEPPKVTTYDAKFVKTDGAGKKLAGAEFYVTRTLEGNKTEYLAKADGEDLKERVKAYTTAEDAYQQAIKDLNEQLKKPANEQDSALVTKLNGNEDVKGSIKQLEKARNDAYSKMKIEWKWIDGETDAFVFKSNQDGQIYVEGLAKGTYDLVEKTAPDGFAKLTTPFQFTVGSAKEEDYKIKYSEKSEKNDAFEVVNKKIDIPQVGGIGTLIFTVVGVGLMIGAVVAMKKNKEEA